MLPQRLWAGLLGIGFLVVGVLRFIPLPSVPDLSVVQPIHGLIHLVTGVGFVLSAILDSGRRAEVLNRWLGIFYVLLGLLGLPGVVLFSDNATHLVVGLASCALGWASPWSSAWRRQSDELRSGVARCLCGLLGLSFAMAGAYKLRGKPSMVEEFSRIGLGQWLRIAIGSLEVGAALAVLIPAARPWTSAALSLLMAGACGINLFVLHRSALAPAILLLLSLVVLGTSERRGVARQPDR